MKQTRRKFWGIFLLLGILIIYAFLASIIYEKFLIDSHAIILIIYFAIAGFLWVLPAALVIRWMARPD